MTLGGEISLLQNDVETKSSAGIDLCNTAYFNQNRAKGRGEKRLLAKAALKVYDRLFLVDLCRNTYGSSRRDE